MPVTNQHGIEARLNKMDEFYTRLEDIQKELYNYTNCFRDKIVYLNCDDGEYSNFWRYFYQKFNSLGLKKLIATSYHEEGSAFKYEYEGGYSDYTNYLDGVKRTKLEGNGDFRSAECIEILKTADIVVTNPPFSLFHEFIKTLLDHDKKFIVWGNSISMGARQTFTLLKEKKMWPGYLFHESCSFVIPDYYPTYDKKFTAKMNDGKRYATVSTIGVYTNIELARNKKNIKYYTKYDETVNPKYDSFDAIEVGKSKSIPCDYTGVMGVPISWFKYYRPAQFDLIGVSNNGDLLGIPYTKNTYAEINGKRKYSRILIKWKPEAMPILDENGIPVYR